MDAQTFAKIVNDLQVVKRKNSTGAITLTHVNAADGHSITAAGVPNPNFRIRQTDLVDCFNTIIRLVATRLHYIGDPSKYYAKTPADVASHIVVAAKKPGSKDIVYIRAKRGYNNNGSKNRTKTSRKGEHTQTMKNRKVTLTLFTLTSGFALTLQITGASKDATAWTRFCDPDLSKPEYDNITWTKDVASTNKAAVDAVDAMIQIETDYVDGKLDKSDAVEQLKEKYIEWVVAHLGTNPEFVERRIPGLNADENLMAAYLEDDAEAEPEAEQAESEAQ